MPGIVLGLLSGFFLDSRVVVLLVTIGANAMFYRFVFTRLIWLYSSASKRAGRIRLATSDCDFAAEITDILSY
jgi:hypothetical protein